MVEFDYGYYYRNQLYTRERRIYKRQSRSSLYEGIYHDPRTVTYYVPNVDSL